MHKSLAIDISKRSVVYLTIEDGHAQQVGSGGAGIVATVIEADQDNQQVIDARLKDC